MKKLIVNSQVEPTSFMSINDTAKYTGFSRFSIRDGCKSGKIPHVVNGGKYMIDIKAFLDIQHRAAEMSVTDYDIFAS